MFYSYTRNFYWKCYHYYIYYEINSSLFHQVCGSDGKTYESECHLKLQACRTQEDIVVQAFGPCKLGEIAGTAGPLRPSSPIQFTQQDDGAASKSTRHLLNPDKYNKYDWTSRKETPSDFDNLLSGQKFKGKLWDLVVDCLLFLFIRIFL